MLSVKEMVYINRWVGDVTYTVFVWIDGIYKAIGVNGQYIKGSVRRMEFLKRWVKI